MNLKSDRFSCNRRRNSGTVSPILPFFLLNRINENHREERDDDHGPHVVAGRDSAELNPTLPDFLRDYFRDQAHAITPTRELTGGGMPSSTSADDNPILMTMDEINEYFYTVRPNLRPSRKEK